MLIFVHHTKATMKNKEWFLNSQEQKKIGQFATLSMHTFCIIIINNNSSSRYSSFMPTKKISKKITIALSYMRYDQMLNVRLWIYFLRFVYIIFSTQIIMFGCDSKNQQSSFAYGDFFSFYSSISLSQSRIIYAHVNFLLSRR